MNVPPKPWDPAIVRVWLERRVAAARADQVAAEREGRGSQDACDKAAAEEMVCGLLLRTQDNIETQGACTDALKQLLDRDDYAWRGVYDDTRFDRHVRTYVRKLVKMTKDNAGFEQTRRYQ